MFFLVKILVSAVVIAVVSEIARRYTSLGGLIAAMPITTLLTLFWLYYDTESTQVLTEFVISVFWGIFPTLFFFITAIILFKKGYSFYTVIGVSLLAQLAASLVHQHYLG